MKIAIINTVIDSGSTGRICIDLYNQFINKGHEVKCFFGRGTNLNNKDFIKIGSNLDIYLHAFLSRIFDNSGFLSRYTTKLFIKRLNIYCPDVIFVNNIHGYYLNLPLLVNYFQTVKSKIFWTLHDCWLFTGHCCYFETVHCNKWMNECGKCPALKSYPACYFFDRSRKNLNRKKNAFANLSNDAITFITPSNWLKNYVSLSYLNRFKCICIPNGVNLDVFNRSNFDIKIVVGNRKIILGIANIWDGRKGYKDFLALSEKLTDDYMIIIVGKILGNKIKKDNILYIDRTNNVYELVDLYCSAEWFINLSHEDNYPTTIIESLACGTPVITYDVGGCSELPDKNYVVREGDITTILSLISKKEDYVFPNETLLSKAEMSSKYLDLIK